MTSAPTGRSLGKVLLIALWSVGILSSCLWLLLGIVVMVHYHQVSIKGITFISFFVWLGYTSFRFLREELGGPVVQFKPESPLSEEHVEKLRSLLE